MDFITIVSVCFQLCGHNPVSDVTTESDRRPDTVGRRPDGHVVENVKHETEIAMTTSHKPQTLQQEFSLINKNINNVTIEEVRVFLVSDDHY